MPAHGRRSCRTLAARLTAAARLTVLTGAGVSAASGVPTFRGEGGLWRTFRAEDLAVPEAFARDPRLVWEWYDWRRQIVAGCAPNAAHRVLARWGRRPGFTLVTQNVDGLHELAGSPEVARVSRLNLVGPLPGPVRGLAARVDGSHSAAAGAAAAVPALRRHRPARRGVVRRDNRPARLRARPGRDGLRRLPDGGHLGGRLPRRGARARGQPAGRVHGGNRPRADPRVRVAGYSRCRGRWKNCWWSWTA